MKYAKEKEGKMKKLFSFLMITLFMFVVIEIFNAEDISMTSQKFTYTFTTDALASLNESETVQSTQKSEKIDTTTILLLGSGLIGLAGFGRKKINQ